MPKTLHWESPQETHTYEPLYLANGHFGGLLNLSGTDMNLWSSNLLSTPEPVNPNRVSFPVTALRTQVYYQSPYFRDRGLHISNAAILSTDPVYTSNDAMPHKCTIYRNRQSLDLSRGVASTRGTVYAGSRASLEAGAHPERAIPFTSEVVFLKGSPVVSFRITAKPEQTGIFFDPIPVLEEVLKIDNSGNSILSLGNRLKTDIHLRQNILGQQVTESEILITKQGTGAPVHSIRIRTSEGRVSELSGRPVIEGTNALDVRVEILTNTDLRTENIPVRYSSHEEVLEENAKRWSAFWNRSRVSLPASLALWQERYEASLFYVAQSLGDGPTHPVGLSQPMLPYWYGSFHDTDTYFCRPLLETGHFNEASLNLRFRHRILARAREVADLLGQEGALYPWQVDANGNGEAVDVPVNHAIIACEAWHQFRFQGDHETRSLSGEIVEAVFQNLQRLAFEKEGTLFLVDDALHTFSETISASHPAEAYLSLRAVAEAYLDLLQSGYEPQDPSLKARAQRILRDLSIPTDERGNYAIVRDGDPEYLRCPSITLGTYPLQALLPDDRMRQAYDKELGRIVSVFAWMPHQLSTVASRLQISSGPKSAFSLLEQSAIFYKTWHAFDEWENRRTARAKIFVTAAGGLCTAIHHMLLAETDKDTYTLFPGTPGDWHTCSFDNLHTMHGWRISARKEKGLVVHVDVRPSQQHPRPVTIRIPNPAPRLALPDTLESIAGQADLWTAGGGRTNSRD